MPLKEVTDMKISYARRFLLLSAIQSNTLTVYYQSLDNINFDESVDTIPSSSNQERSKEPTEVFMATNIDAEDVVMRSPSDVSP